MTRPGGDDRSLINRVFGNELPQESTDERDYDARPVTMRSAKWTEEEPDYEDDRERWFRENVPPHHI
jgi:hypothetical protein